MRHTLVCFYIHAPDFPEQEYSRPAMDALPLLLLLLQQGGELEAKYAAERTRYRRMYPNRNVPKSKFYEFTT